MAQKREQRFTVQMLPWRAGLATAGQQTTIPEDQLWQAKNVTGMLDGMLGKRPGTTQWGQTLKAPTEITVDSVMSFVTFLSGIGGFTETENSGGDVTHDTAKPGRLRTSVVAGTSNENSLSHAIDTQSLLEEWSLRFVFSGTGLPAYTPAATTPNTFVFRAHAANNTGKEFAIHSGGIYYKLDSDDTYQLISGTTKAGQGTWTTIEVRCDDSSGGGTSVYIDDVLVTTTPIVSATMKDVVPSGATTDFEFQWQAEGTGSAGTQYNTNITTAMYNDVLADPFGNKTIDGITDFQFVTQGGSEQATLVVAAGDYIYADNGLFGAWRPLLARQYRSVAFTQYRDKLIWIDGDGSKLSTVWTWDGSLEPEKLEDAPPIQFADEHQRRIIASGDPLHPLRVYYTGVNQPDTWFSPSPTNIEDSFDDALEAGYLDLPSGEGDKVTAGWGDYYGMASVWT